MQSEQNPGWNIIIVRCLWISHYANMVPVKVSFSSEKLLAFMSIFLLMQLALMFYHRVVNTTESLGHGGVRWGARAPAVNLWYEFHFLPSILTAGESLWIFSSTKTSALRPRSPPGLPWHPPHAAAVTPELFLRRMVGGGYSESRAWHAGSSSVM